MGEYDNAENTMDSLMTNEEALRNMRKEIKNHVHQMYKIRIHEKSYAKWTPIFLTPNHNTRKGSR